MSKPNRIRSFSWQPQIKTIRDHVAKIDTDRLCRTDIEALFGITRNPANQLMRMIGAELHGGTLFVTKRELQRFLAAIARSADYARDERRRQRVQAAITEAAHQWELKATTTGVSQREFQRRQEGLPEGITLAPESLTINFKGGNQFLRRLALLAAWCGQNQERIAEL